VAALAVLDAVPAGLAETVGGFLAAHPPKDVIEQLQAVQTAALLGIPPVEPIEAVRGRLERFRAADGGYGKHPSACLPVGMAAEGSTYWSYLAALCYDLLGERAPNRGRLRAFLRRRRCADGGFSETGRLDQGSTNATAAGVGLAALAGLLALPMIPPALGFLARMQSPSGGFLAGPRVPAPDLLSTFTASVALTEARAADRFDVKQAAAFAANCADPAGGFRAAPWDEAADVEYAFYGLGCRGLLT
jgi:geranylgeranyl transferase type-2 subunit beta